MVRMVQVASKVKIAHLSDIHIKDVRRNEYSEIFRLLYQKLRSVKPNIIVVCGDIFHDKTKASAYNFSDVGNFLSSLVRIAPVILIPGNHDMNIKIAGSPDLLSPIFRNHSILKEPRFIYWRNSGVYAAHGISWVVIAPDQDKPSGEEIESFILKNQMEGAARICLLHETVNGSLLFNGNFLKSKKVRVEDLVGYDAVLAGDIHLRQSIGKNGRAMYAGSLIQQNLGENYENHGFLLWEIELSGDHPPYRTVNPRITPFNIHNKRGFLKVCVRKGVDKTQSTRPSEPNYYEITYDSETSHENLAEHIGKYSLLYGFPPRAVRLVKPFSETKEHTTLTVQEVYREAQSLAVHERIITEILGVDNHLLEDILDVHRHHYKQMSTWEGGRVRVRLLRLEFSNFYCYGANNFVDFTKMEGKISGIIAPNQAGKSSFLDILLFALYEEYPRADKKMSIINDKASEYYVKLYFEIDGKTGYVEKNGRKGKQLQSGNCRLFYNGDDLTKGTSTLTCREIEKLVGTYKNAEFTTFLHQNIQTDFVHLRPNERKEVLAKLLFFTFFEDLEGKVKGEQSDLNIELRILEKNFAGTHTEQLESDYENLTMQFSRKQESLDRMLKELSGKKDLLERCLLAKEKIISESSEISQRVNLLESFEKVDFEMVSLKLESLQSITGETDLSYNECENYDVKIPVGFSPNLGLVKVLRKSELAVVLAKLEARKIREEKITSSNFQLLKKLELKKERLSVFLENLFGELNSNCQNIHFDSIQLTIKEPVTFFKKEEGIPWNSSKLGPPVTREQIDWATSCLSTSKTSRSELFIEIIQKISLLSNIRRPFEDGEEGEYEKLSAEVSTYKNVIANEGELLSRFTSAKEKYLQTSSEVELWKSVFKEDVELLSEDNVLSLDLASLKESFGSFIASANLTEKLVGLLDEFAFSKKVCRNCRQNEVVLRQMINSQRALTRENVGRQIFSLLSQRLRREGLLIVELEKEVSNLSFAKGNLQRFVELQAQQATMLDYTKLMKEKAYWEERRRAVEILEVAAYWWLEDRKLWDSYSFIFSKLPILKNLKRNLNTLDKEINKANENLHRKADEFRKFLASTREMVLVRKYWLGEVFKYGELVRKAKAYILSVKENTDLRNKLLENEKGLADHLSQINTYQGEIESMQNERGELTGTLSIIKDKLIQKKQEVKREKERSRQLSSKQRKLELISMYRKIVDPKTGLADKLLKRSVSYLQNEVNLVLSECGASFSICFTGDFELKTLVGTGRQLSTIPSKLSSGYQKFVLSLAFRSALRRLSEVTLPDCQFIDEGFGNCDEENLELITQYISSDVKSSLSPKLFFIISHIDTMKNAIQEPLTIEVKGLRSYIRN